MKLSLFDVAWHIFQENGITRKDLSSEFGMSLSGVSVIVNKLRDLGIVEETPLEGSRIGRSPSTLIPNPKVLNVCGVDMASYDITVGIYDFGMEKLEERFINLSSSEDFLKSSASAIGKMCDGTDYIGVSLPGIIESHSGILLSAAIPELEGKDVKRILENITGKHVCVVNDANAATIAEYHRRKKAKSLLGVFFSRGIGMGYMRNGEIFMGTNGYAGELGGIFVDESRKLDDVIYVENLPRRAEDLSETLNPSHELFGFVSDVVSRVISSLVYLFDPGLVVLISRKELSDDGVDMLRSRVLRVLEYPFNKETRIEGRILEDNPAVYGSAILAAKCWLNEILTA